MQWESLQLSAVADRCEKGVEKIRDFESLTTVQTSSCANQ
jgi:hypothetical protein